MDYSHANQLIWSEYSPSDMSGHFLENGHLERGRLDIMHNNQQTCFYLLQWYAQMQYRAYGVGGVFAPNALIIIGKLLACMGASHLFSWWHWIVHRSAGDNRAERVMRKEIENYPANQSIALQKW